jgi:ATP-binding cassette subfamily B protein
VADAPTAEVPADDAAADDIQAETFTLQEYFTPTERKRLRRMPHLVRISFRLVWSSAKRELLEVVAIQALMAVGVAAQLLVVRSLLSHIVGKSPSFSAIIPQLVALALVSLVVGAAGAVLGLRIRLLSQLVARQAIDGVIRTAISVDLITYDAPGFHDRLQRAQLSAATRPAAIVQELITGAGSLLSVAGIAFALVLIQPLFCLLVLVAYVPVWFTTNRAGRMGYRQTVAQTEQERKRQYLFQTLTSKPPAQEIRAFGVGSFLADRQDGIYETLLDSLRKVLRRRIRMALVGQAMTGLLSALALGALVWFVTTGRMSLSAAGSAAGAMVLLSGRLHGIASSSAGLYENSLYLEDYVNFVGAAPRIAAGRPTAPVHGPPQALAADGVTFTYPSRSRPSLTRASLTLRRGEVVALVGENGSGKTTFAKLLAGLYTPSEGTVTWDGTDLTTLDPAAVTRQVAVIFQDFVRYLLPAHDNIALGDPDRFDDRQAVEEAARAAGIHDTIASLRHGYDTILGPAYYGGSDLSGGQWQRIALARLFFRDSPIVILDEPTASLDPRAEAALYASMRTLFADRGVLLITHRFASGRTADRIYVLRDGELCEAGTHEELIAAGGYYSELYGIQASQFRD